MSRTIKSYIRSLWELGSPTESIVVLVQETFPHHCGSRSYVMRLVNEFNREKNLCQSKA